MRMTDIHPTQQSTRGAVQGLIWGMTCPIIGHWHGPVYARKRASRLRVWIDAIAP
jgi:hypothetical protein